MKRILLLTLFSYVMGLLPNSLSAACVDVTISIDMSEASNYADLGNGQTLWMRSTNSAPNGATVANVKEMLEFGGCTNVTPPGNLDTEWDFYIIQPFTVSAANDCVYETTFQLDDQLNGGAAVSWRYTLHIDDDSNGIWAQATPPGETGGSGTCYNYAPDKVRILSFSPGVTSHQEEITWDCEGNCNTCVPVTINIDMTSYDNLADLNAGNHQMWLKSGNNAGTSPDILNSFPCISNPTAGSGPDFRNIGLFTNTGGNMYSTTLFMNDDFNAGQFNYLIGVFDLTGGSPSVWVQRGADFAETQGDCHNFSNTRQLAIPAVATNVDLLWNCTASALPVDLIKFNGTPQKRMVNLDWSTASEQNNDYFLVEHSVDGQRFTEVGMVSGKGTSNELTKYSFDHAKPNSGLNYYRLKQVDFDEGFEYSNVISVMMREAVSVSVYPTVTKSVINVNFLRADADAELSIISQVGKQMQVNTLRMDNGTAELDVSALPQGVYFLVVNQNGELETTRFVKH